MSFKLYVTCICCIIRNTIQIHHKPSSTYIYIQQSIVFGHLLLHIHYLMADHLDSALWRPGSQRFAPFLVRLLVFRSRDVTGPWAAVRLVCNVCMCECVCMCLQFGLYTMPTPFLFLSQTLSKNLIRFTTLGGLCSIWLGATSFWSECRRHCWFPSKLVSVPEALKTASLWRRRLGGALPPSTTVTSKSSALRPPPLLISSYTACSTGRICALCLPCQPHKRRILHPTQSSTLQLRVSCWRRLIGAATSINQVSHQILYPAHNMCMFWLTYLNNIQMYSNDIKDIYMLYVFSHDISLHVWT